MTAMEENVGMSRFLSFSQIISNDLSIVNIDHCYSKPWSSHPDASNARPLRMLFMEKFPYHSSQEKLRSTDVIDVVGDGDPTSFLFDAGKPRVMPSDEVIHPEHDDSRDDWEDHIAGVRTSWSVLQNRFFAKVMRVLQADRLARLSIYGIKNESIQRKLQIDKVAKRVRYIFASIRWDMTLILWLHDLLLENLRGHLLTSYLEVLARLKSKIPSLVEQLLQSTASKQGHALESLSGLLKKNLDPALPSINQRKLKKLPNHPLLLLISSAPSSSLNPMAIKRHKFWHHQLAAMGKIINIAPSNNTANIPVSNYVENMITTAKFKVLEVKSHFPGRPIILIGWHFGALIATHIALTEIVHGIVCLGFPTMGVYGNRGEIDDHIYMCKTPTLFVVGQHANSCSIDTLEDIREKLRVETGLLLVGGADDHLRMSSTKKRSCGVTQTMVDRCIMAEMFEFLGSILSQTVVQPESTENAELIRKQRKRKQKGITPTADLLLGNLPQQPAMKTVRPLKLCSTGSNSYGGQWSVAGSAKIVKRSHPKKPAVDNDGIPASNKKSMLHLSFPKMETSNDQSAQFLKVSEAAAIASAPELSNLLQNINTTEQKKLASNSSSFVGITNASSPCQTTIGTTTALTLSRFLVSSGFLRTDAIMKAKDSALENLKTTALKSNLVTLRNETPDEQRQHFYDASQQQPQILIRPGISSVPFSIPLTFSMASKVLKSTPVLSVSGSSSDLTQIQQLLTSMSESTLPSLTSSTTSSTAISSPSFLVGSHTSSNALSTSTLGMTFSSTSTPLTPAVGVRTLSPGASVINIGNDSVFMKETPPNTNSVPGTVSIDLGQIAAGASNNTMKVTTTPKISLIPAVKQIPVSGLTERLLLTAPLTASQPTIATLSSSSSHSQYSQLGKSTAVPTTVASLKPASVSTDSMQSVNSAAPNSIISMSSSQLLTTLSANTGLIALKISNPCVSNNRPTQEVLSDRDDLAGQVNETSTELKGYLNSPNMSHYSNLKLISKNTATQSGNGECLKQHFQLDNPAGTNPESPLLRMPKHKTESEQVVLHCQRPASYSPQPATIKSSSPQLHTYSSSETLGKVTSLFESCPVTKEKSHTQSSKVTSPTLMTFSPSSSSCLTGHSSFKSNKTTVSSYTATHKPVLSTIASTRTRRIRTPKQYDL